ncbi:MAG: DUF4407 domain-containing protein [Pseudonocardia sp.]
MSADRDPSPSRSGNRPGNLMVWLGGGSWRDLADPAERAVYQATGAMVLLAALVGWAVAALGAATIGGLGALAAAGATWPVGLLIGALGRVLATAPVAPGRRAALLGPVAVAVLAGVLLGELAACAIFTGPVASQLDTRVDRAAAAVAGGERATQLAGLRAERAGLDDRVDQAVARRDAALLVARCEFRPAPGCPPQLITGDPGRGPEAEQARAALTGADADLAVARADRDRRVPELDQVVATVSAQLDADRARAEALARADTGPIAHWRAMNAYTADHPAAVVPRLLAVIGMVLLVLLPLLLRVWRGTTEQDRLLDAQRLRRRAELEADTAIALRRAEVRAARELRRQDELLAADTDQPVLGGRAERLAGSVGERAPIGNRAAAVGLDAPDEERLALCGGNPTPVGTAPVGTAPVGTAPAGTAPTGTVPTGTDLVPAGRRGLLDLLPGPLPVIGRAVTGMAGAIVPTPVARLAGSAARPVRVVRTLLEEVEELQFSLRHKRTVRVSEERTEADPGADPEAAAEDTGALPEPHRTVVVTRVERDPGPAVAAGAEPAPLETGRRALPGKPGA